MNKQTWIVMVSSLLLMIMMGSVYTWSVFRPTIEQQYSVNVTASGLPYMVSLVFYAFSMMVTGRYMTSKNVRIIGVIGSLLIGVGWLLAGQATHLMALSICYGVIVGIGIGMVYGIPIYIIQRSFASKSGLYTGIVLGGFGMSPLFSAPLINRLLMSVGLSMTFSMIGLLYLFALVLCAYVLTSVHFIEDSTPALTEISPMNIPLFMTMYGLFVIATSIGLMMIGLSYKIGVDYYQYSPHLMTLQVSFFAVCNGLARPLFGWIMDKKGFTYAAGLSLCLMGCAAIISLFNQGNYVILFTVAFGLLWFNLGAWLAIIPSAVKHYFGLTHYTKVYGIMFTAYGFGAISGVLLSGSILDVFTTTYHLYTTILIMVVIAFYILIHTRKLFKFA